MQGQEYDEVNNMNGDINGLKTPILKKKNFICVLCSLFCSSTSTNTCSNFKKNKSIDCGWIFEILVKLLNVIRVFCKRKNVERSSNSMVYYNGELGSGKGLNKELSLGRSRDTLWNLTINRL